MPVRGHLLATFCAGLLAVLPAGPAVPHVPVAGPAAQRAPAAAPADLAVRFEALLGQHSVLAADLMRSRIRGDDDFVQAANAALTKNTDDMTALVRDLFGASTAAAFAPKWAEHIVALVAYASALAEQDDAARAEAHEELVEYEEELAEFFAGASKGRLPLAGARAAVVMHVEHLTGQADAYAKRDYATADQLYRAGYQHTYDLGLALSNALLPARDVATLREPLWRLRSQLGKLLAEHAVLVEDVTRSAVTGSPDFDASADMINGNTRDLTAAMDTLFGARAAGQFQTVWSDHVEQLVAYGSAAAARDAAKQERVRAELSEIEQRMATFLAGATGRRMSPTDLAATLHEHDEMLLKHADAYAARDFATAHNVAYDTYENMFELARRLADAFGATVAARLPRGGAQTGYGGLATGERR
jgi:hypothetical protein